MQPVVLESGTCCLGTCSLNRLACYTHSGPQDAGFCKYNYIHSRMLLIFIVFLIFIALSTKPQNPQAKQTIPSYIRSSVLRHSIRKQFDHQESQFLEAESLVVSSRPNN